VVVAVEVLVEGESGLRWFLSVHRAIIKHIQARTGAGEWLATPVILQGFGSSSRGCSPHCTQITALRRFL
jgi:hypothetical protein